MRLRTDYSWSVMTFRRIVVPLWLFDLSIIFSENRYPLFPIMLQAGSEYRPYKAGLQADRVPILTFGYR
jgi:hypothetical protein